jgi:phage shock protein PspC (stress-responsive transcriptional regulator)
MNKTIIININGIVFHIEEDAYEILKHYMTDVKRHFAYTAGSDEIVSDIENRIAEMFVERLEQEKKQVIVSQDVEFVTAQMGSVADFDVEGDDEAPFTVHDSLKSERKLFRDTDDRVIGGVCSGVGHYFNIEPKWIRLITIFFIFMGGSGLLIYGILWIATPVAKTRADKMAMKGEEPTLQNFKKNFDEELDALNKNLSPALSTLERGIRDFFNGLASFINAILKGFVKLIGALIIFACVVALLALIIATFGLFGWNSELSNFPFNAINPEYKGMMYLAAFIIAFIPLLALFFFAIRVVFNKPLITKTGSFVMLIIWICGLCIGAFYGTKLGSEFKNEASFSETMSIKPSPIYYLKLSDKKFLTAADSMRYNISSKGFKKGVIINYSDDDFNENNHGRMHLKIERSDSDKPELIQTFSSQGRDFETALHLAQGIAYSYEQVDSVLQFDRTIHIDRDVLWRNQEVTLTLKIPKNTRLVIDENVYWYFRDFNTFDCDRKVIMTGDGLKCDSTNIPRVNKKI